MTRHEQWRKWYEEEKKKPYFRDIWDKMSAMDKTALLSPEKHLWLKALEFSDFSKIKVVMVSSYPHPDTYSADGYAFSSIDEPDYETGVLHRRLESELGIALMRRITLNNAGQTRAFCFCLWS